MKTRSKNDKLDANRDYRPGVRRICLLNRFRGFYAHLFVGRNRSRRNLFIPDRRNRRHFFYSSPAPADVSNLN